MVTSDRWFKAQGKEKSFQHITTTKPNDKPTYKLNEKYHLPNDYFNEKTVLEVGVALFASIHRVAGASVKVGLDPLARFYSPNYPKSVLHIQAVGEILPFPSESFDSILCINVLDHTLKPELVLSEIRRCLKKGGYFLFEIDTFKLPRVARNRLGNIDAAHPHHFSFKEIMELMEAAGFRQVRVAPSDIRLYLRSTKVQIQDRRLSSAFKVLFAKFFTGLEEKWILLV
jgi:SAM-dependent methyltransferase